MDELMRINGDYAWAACDLSVYARPTVPCHSFIPSDKATRVMATSQTAPHLAH
jgi:hypothetical protein